MSQENIEIVRQIYDAFARRDTEASFAHYAPDIEWDLSGGYIYGPGATFRGHEGVSESFRDLLQAFSSVDFAVEEMTDAGDHVLVDVHERHTGRESGVDVDRRHYALWKLSDRKVVQMRVYRERSEALEAAGLTE